MPSVSHGLPLRHLPLLVALFVTTTAAVAAAQDAGPIGGFVVDVRGSLTRFGTHEELALTRGFRDDQLPANGLGLEAGAHVYVGRWRAITFGLGASVLWSSGEKAPLPDEEPGGVLPDETEPTIRTRLTAFSPQVSFNFGDGDGWSYISGGLGQSRLSVFDVSADEPPQRYARTINYGGGARWFAKSHLAFTFDLRFYAVSPLEQMEEEPGSPRMTLLAFNVGVAFK